MNNTSKIFIFLLTTTFLISLCDQSHRIESDDKEPTTWQVYQNIKAQPEKYDPFLTNFFPTDGTFETNMESLKKDLEQDKSNIVLFSIGAAGELQQIFPHYLKKIAEQNPDKQIKIYDIEPSIIKTCNSDIKIEQKNITLISFRTIIPSNKEHNFYEVFKDFIHKKITNKKIVFIANYTASNRFFEILEILEIYNQIKHDPSLDPEFFVNLQLHSQCGGGKPWFIYDPILLSTSKTEIKEDGDIKYIEINSPFEYIIETNHDETLRIKSLKIENE